MERGTLYQLRNLINRRNVLTKPKADVNAAEDFLEIVVIGYVISAVITYLKMASFDDIPDHCIVPEDVWMEDDSMRAAILQDISCHIVNEYIDLDIVFKGLSEAGAKTAASDNGTVYHYTCEVLSLGLLYINFKGGDK